MPLKSNVGPKVDGLAASEREDQLLYSPQRTAILTEASQALTLRPSVVLATNPSAEPQSSHAKPRRATSKGVLLQRLESEFWAACRDGDIYKVERMKSTDPLRRAIFLIGRDKIAELTGVAAPLKFLLDIDYYVLELLYD